MEVYVKMSRTIMNRTIRKYLLLPTQLPQNIVTKKGAILRYMQAEGESLCLWMEIDEIEIKEESRMVTVVGTGWSIPDDGLYLGTSTIGNCVWHVYGKPEDWTSSKGKKVTE